MKATLLKIAAAAAGVTLALFVAAAFTLWYISKPKALKPWNEKALIANDSPGFSTYGDKDLTISLAYVVKNTTESDYSVEAQRNLKVVAVFSSGELSSPIDSEHLTVRTPIFIPAHQAGTVVLHLNGFHAPDKNPSETDESYHERLRQAMNDRMPNVRGFAIFDDVNRYQLNLRQWEKTKREKNAGP